MKGIAVSTKAGGFLVLLAWLLLSLSGSGSPLVAVFSSADDVAVTAPSYNASGTSISVTLSFSPSVGTPLKLVDQTGIGFIEGTFTNLTHGQSVNLQHNGKNYRYVANYYGGNGNDLVLQWASVRPLAWGYNDSGQLGNGGTTTAALATPVDTTGVLAGKTILAVAMGGKHSLALCSDGTLAAWGANNNGQLGHNSTAASSPVPVRVVQTGVLAGKNVIAIAAGNDHNLALCSDGTVAAWGNTNHGKLGDGAATDRRFPVAVNTSGVLAGKRVVRIAAGHNHSLALCSDGTVVAWGRNDSGQLGNGQTLEARVPLTIQQSGVLAGKQVIALGGGEFFSLALCSDGTLASWGSNNSGQLGNGGNLRSTVPVLVNRDGVLAGKSVVEIATGYSYALVRCTDGTIAGWSSKMGNGTFAGETLPSLVDASGVLAGKTPRQITTGSDFGFALTRDGMLAMIENSKPPVEVVTAHLPEGEKFCDIGNGSSAIHYVGLAAMPYEPRMRVEHANLRVRLDDSATMDFGAVAPGSGSVERSLIIHNDGIESLMITGLSLSGDHAGDFSLGAATVGPIAPGGSALLPVTFAPGAGFHRRASLRIDSNDPYRDAFEIDLSATVTGAFAVSLGDSVIHAISTKAITVAGSTILPTLTAQPPVGVTYTLVENTGSEFITGVFANLAHGQVISLNHGGTDYRFIVNYYGGSGNDLVLQWAATRLAGWGDNSSDQLLTGSTAGVLEPTSVPFVGALGGKTIISVISGYGFSMALCADGSIIGWGRNVEGQLGNGSTATTSQPVEVNRSGVLAGRTVIALSAHYGHCLALCSDGTMVAWGMHYGTLPVVVPASAAMAFKRVVAIDVGYNRNLALCSDGSVFQWGAHPVNQPTEVHRLRTLHKRAVDAISAGNEFSLALCSDGILVSWGRNSWGNLGIGNWTNPPLDEALPVDVTGVLAGKTIRAFSAGYNHAIALCDDGTLATWGGNSNGELGNGISGSSNDSNTPVAVIQNGILAGREPVSVVAAYQSCVVGLADGGLAAWGDDPLGKGDFLSSSTPVEVFTRTLVSGERLLAPRPGSYSTHKLALVALPQQPRLAVEHESGIRVANERNVVDFGATATGNPLETAFTLRNDGIEPLSIASISIQGRDAADFSFVSPPPTSIAPGASSDVVIRFTAARVFVREARLAISSNDPENPFFTVGLAATISGTLDAEWPDATTVPLSASAFTATGSVVDLTLAHLPETGAELTLVEITGMDCITGRFSNLSQGEEVVLGFGGKSFRFVANYYGGSGNDLVLQWAAVRPFCWGLNSHGQLGDGTITSRYLPGPISLGALAGRTPVALAARSNYTLALCADGGLVQWGRQSTDPRAGGPSTPVATGTTGVLVGRTVAAIAVGDTHNLALCTDGTLAAWGNGSSGMLGQGSTDTSSSPVGVDQTGVLSGRRVVAIAAGNSHSLALCSDGTIAAWGSNSSGQLGDQTTMSRSRPVEVTGTGVLAGRRVIAIAAGSAHSLALCDDGTVVAWGSNQVYGQLGNGGFSNSYEPVAVDQTGVLAGKFVAAIAAGERFSLALCADGTIAAWGDNSIRQFGNGGTASSRVPVLAATGNPLGGRMPREVSAGRRHSLTQGAPGIPTAWGYNFSGVVGDGTVSSRSQPVTVSTANLRTEEAFIRTAITQGNDHSVALVAQPYIPRIALQKGTNASFPASGSSLFFEPKGIGLTTTETLALRNNGTVPLALGEIAITGPHAAEFQITAAAPAELAPGATASLAITFTAGMGFNRSAELSVPSNDPYVPEIRLALASSGSATLVASYTTGKEVPLQTSRFHPAGSSVSLSLAYEPVTGANLMVVEVTGPLFMRGAFDNLAPGQEVILDWNGRSHRFIANYYGGNGNDLVLEWAAVRPVAWGSNSSGQLGSGDTVERPIPSDIFTAGVLAGKRVTSLAAGYVHSLALCADGTLAAWGNNDRGGLGDGTTQSSLVPVLVSRSGVLAGKTVVAIAAGNWHSMALCSDGTVYAWGFNYGLLGNNSSGGTHALSTVPVAVTTTGALAGKFVTAIATGGGHNLVLCSDGTLVSWGTNSSGALGNASVSGVSGPIAVDMGGVLVGKTVTAIASGASHSIVLCSDGTLAAWGANSSGQLGIGTTTSKNVPALVDRSGVLTGKTVMGVAAGSSHSLALCADGTVAAWGYNAMGQLGNGTNTDSPVPVLVSPAGFAPRRLSAGWHHSTLSGVPGEVAFFGQNNYGQLGDGTLTARNVPVAMSPEWQLPGDQMISLFTSHAAYHTMGLVAEPAAPRIEEWRMLYYLTPDNTGNAADSAAPLGDGVTNLMKFATGMNPQTAGQPQIHALVDGETLLFTYPRSEAARRDGLIFQIEFSHDLTMDSWQRLNDPAETIKDLGLLQQVTVAVPIETGQPLFLRLRVQNP